MYEDRTQEVITQEMLEDFGANVRTDTGSLAYNAVVKTASELEDVYTDMSDVADNALADTMDLLHLIRYGAERGVAYKYATSAEVKAVFGQSMSIGNRVMCQDYIYDIKSQVEDVENTYLMTCEEDGTGPNTITGELEPVDYIDGWVSGAITEVVVLGTDDEDIDVFRERVLGSFTALAFGGNRADYRQFIDGIDGVGGCKPIRREADSQWINIYFIDSDYSVPSSTLTDNVQTLVDPETNHGEGYGKAAIGQMVQIIPVDAVTINIETTLTLESGYDIEAIEPQVVQKVSDYLLSIRKAWEGAEQNSLTVRVAQIEAALISIEGVIDVNALTINDEDANVSIEWTKIPVLGTVIVS